MNNENNENEIICDISNDEKEIIKEYLLNNIETAIDVARQFNCYNGMFDWSDVWDLEDLCNCTSAKEIARAIIYGDVHNMFDDVRYNAYGNLETATESDLENDVTNDIDEIVELLYTNYKDITIYDKELLELLNI